MAVAIFVLFEILMLINGSPSELLSGTLILGLITGGICGVYMAFITQIWDKGGVWCIVAALFAGLLSYFIAASNSYQYPYAIGIGGAIGEDVGGMIGGGIGGTIGGVIGIIIGLGIIILIISLIFRSIVTYPCKILKDSPSSHIDFGDPGDPPPRTHMPSNEVKKGRRKLRK